MNKLKNENSYFQFIQTQITSAQASIKLRKFFHYFWSTDCITKSLGFKGGKVNFGIWKYQKFQSGWNIKASQWLTVPWCHDKLVLEMETRWVETCSIDFPHCLYQIIINVACWYWLWEDELRRNEKEGERGREERNSASAACQELQVSCERVERRRMGRGTLENWS